MLDSVKQKVTQLIAAYEKEKTERKRLEAKLEEALQVNETYRKQINELGRQIDNRKLADAFTNSGDIM